MRKSAAHVTKIIKISTETRDISATIKLSEQDLELLDLAAKKKWPDIELTRSARLRGLAIIGARCIIDEKL